ncbi:2-acylglycerol O-acyltransferase 1-like [Ctenocephalides felis]|uniref:2-acylglycerol O-acyltransferase 1-like n=1 Tax=Ctenocephalides felis TaxID=7515 RepID=UPI000E6E32E3|nr:2-acylglycerol O-acyltransferase 1-like [Ctenocephalides felis]
MSLLKFAPLDTPLERRLQTLAAAGWITTMLWAEFLSIALCLYIVLCSSWYWLGVLYVFWVAIDRDICHQGGRPIKWVRNWTWWRYYRDYFPLTLIKTAELDPKKNYLLCVFPHGLLSSGAFGHFATDATGFQQMFPGMTARICTLAGHFMVPFYRELILSLGGVSASAESINYILGSKEKGKAAVLMVGGAAESLYCKPGTYRIVLKKRKGFVKLALKNGTPLVPVFSFGETDLYDQVSNPEGSLLRKAQEFVKKITGIAFCVPLGRGMLQYSVGIVPRRKPVTTVIGKPLEFQRNLDPSDEDIEKLHSEFTKAITELFEQHKSKYIEDHENIKLVIE